MDLLSLTERQLQEVLREEVQKYIFLSLHSKPEELPEGNIFRSRLLGEIMREVRRRKKG